MKLIYGKRCSPDAPVHGHGRSRLSKYYVEGERSSEKAACVRHDGAAAVQQKVFSFLPRYFVFIGEQQVAETS